MVMQRIPDANDRADEEIILSRIVDSSMIAAIFQKF